jgi:hypothetical protein
MVRRHLPLSRLVRLATVDRQRAMERSITVWSVQLYVHPSAGFVKIAPAPSAAVCAKSLPNKPDVEVPWQTTGT